MPADPNVMKLAAQLAPALKARGFHRKRLLFRRRHGEVTQLVHLQSSMSGGGRLFVNIGVVFDAIAKLRPDVTGRLSIVGVDSARGSSS